MKSGAQCKKIQEWWERPYRHLSINSLNPHIFFTSSIIGFIAFFLLILDAWVQEYGCWNHCHGAFVQSAFPFGKFSWTWIFIQDTPNQKKTITMPTNYPYYICTLSYGLHLCYLFCSKWDLQTHETEERSFSEKKSWNYVQGRIEGLRSRTQACRSGTAISGNKIFSLRAFRVSLFRSIHMFLKA